MQTKKYTQLLYIMRAVGNKYPTAEKVPGFDNNKALLYTENTRIETKTSLVTTQK